MNARIIRGCVCLMLAALGVGSAAGARADDPPRLEPTLEAAPGKANAWTSAGGLRFTWVLPDGLAQGEKRDLVVICHGTGLDYRWGSANYPPGRFRPRDFVVSVDGPSKGPEETRLFMGREEDVAAFAAFLGEVKAAFPVRRVFLYGHSQGSFFVSLFAGEHPEAIDGVVAHASGTWAWAKAGEELHRVPIVFMHGTRDPVVPFGQSVDARESYKTKAAHPTVQLRRLVGYNHWPNAVRVSECLDWCVGLRTDDPAEALAAAESILTPRGPDEYHYECAPWFSGAADILRRFRGQGPRPFPEGKTAGLEGKALALLQRVESHAGAHADAIRAQIKTRDDIKLDGRPWLGHLVSVREDFRGIGPIEQLATDLGYDELAVKHAQASKELTQTWYQGAGDRRIFETVVRVLPACFLCEGLPPEMTEQIPKVMASARELGISPDAIKRYRNFLMWNAGWDEGLKQYEALWRQWK